MKHSCQRTIGVIFAIFLLSSELLISAGPTLAVVGGIRVAPAKRWVVTVRELSVDSLCSGVMVAPEWVVTAEHCTYDQSGTTSVNVFVGHETQAMLRRADVVRPSKASEFVFLHLVDLDVPALNPIVFSPTVPPANSPLLLYGYGCTNVKQCTATENLYATKVNDFTAGGQLCRTEFCVTAPKKQDRGPSGGDSGAPWFSELNRTPEVVGIFLGYETDKTDKIKLVDVVGSGPILEAARVLGVLPTVTPGELVATGPHATVWRVESTLRRRSVSRAWAQQQKGPIRTLSAQDLSSVAVQPG